MSGYRLGHDLDDDPELYAGHVLDEVRLVFEDGENRFIVARTDSYRPASRSPA